MISRYTDIALDIRSKIFNHEWLPGSKLPTREELIELYQSSSATVQKAMDLLLEENFISTFGRSGTYVSEMPPNLKTYALVFAAENCDSPYWDLLWDLLQEKSDQWSLEFNCNFTYYYLDIDNFNSIEFQRLKKDIAELKLAGVIFPFFLNPKLSMELKNSPIPLIMLAKETRSWFSNIWVNYDSFLEESVKYLKKCNRRKVALIANYMLPVESIDTLKNICSNAGLELPDFRMQSVGMAPEAVGWVGNIIDLLLRLPESDRPDGLIITNQAFGTAVIEALKHNQVNLGVDLNVCIHCNFPCDKTMPVGVKQIGFNAKTLLKMCLDILNENRRSGIISHSKILEVEQ